MALSIVIPDSCLIDEKTNLDKSRKISIIARAAAIFKIDTIYIYQDNGSRNDVSLLVTILKYLETPQYLRKRIFPKLNELKYAGVLHPLKIPSHLLDSNPKKIKSGDVRDGVILGLKGKKFIDVGIHQFMPYFGKEQIGKRITVQFKNGFPNFTIKEISNESLQVYWGYKVKERTKLSNFLLSWKGNIILTSRKGKNISKSQIKQLADSKDPTLVVFGSPEKGLDKILGNSIRSNSNVKSLNFFPNQATETVRLDEAIVGVLSILNFLKSGLQIN